MIKETWELTGDPFVDNGLWAITSLAQKQSPDELERIDIEESIKYLKDLLFSGTIDSALRMLWVNHPVYQTSYSPDERELAVNKIFEDLLDWSYKDTTGYNCPICGINQGIPKIRRKAKDDEKRDFRATRTYIPMLGSGKVINFFPQGGNGVPICSSCLLSTQFLPFMIWKSKNLLLVHSRSPEIMKIISKKQTEEVIERQAITLLQGMSGGATRSKNAIYNIVVNIINELEQVDLNPSLMFYDFTNYGQSPNIEGIYYFPNRSFMFLNEINKMKIWGEWNEVVKRGFPRWVFEKKENLPSNELLKEAYKSRPNFVYDNLISGKSIINFFLNSRKRKKYGTWRLLSTYLKVVKNYEA